MEHCRTCKTQLIIGTNWAASRAKNNDRLCRHCATEYEMARRRALRALLATPAVAAALAAAKANKTPSTTERPND